MNRDNFSGDIIYTHPAPHHADEIMAIALLKEVLPGGHAMNIIRSNDPDNLSDMKPIPTSSFVIDVGNIHHPEQGRFDHHQDAELPASNVLVLWALHKAGFIKDYQLDWLLKPFEEISNIDRGLAKASYSSLNSIIGLMNQNKHAGFFEAIGFARSIIRMWLQHAELCKDDVDNWLRCEPAIIGPLSFRIQPEDMAPIRTWKTLAENEGTIGLICASERNAGKWQIISRNTEEWVIPPSGAQLFRHNSGFLAVYNTLSALKMDLAVHITEAQSFYR